MVLSTELGHSISGKLFSKLLEMRILDFAEAHGLRAERQYGFRLGVEVRQTWPWFWPTWWMRSGRGGLAAAWGGWPGLGQIAAGARVAVATPHGAGGPCLGEAWVGVAR